jgi:hypothetical protein|tara:strand:+ start:667 stop:1278 length:612 start_codon:yes stop_codon:yes gene_type:complete
MSVAYEGLNDCVIYDFETLSVDVNRGVVLSLGLLTFSRARFTNNPYSYEELLDSSVGIKYDVKKQVEVYDRKISKSTLDWWNKQPKETTASVMVPSEDDKDISETYNFFVKNVNINNLKTVFSRGNTFDIPFFEGILNDTGKKVPYPFWMVRDTRSFLDGLLWGSDVKNDYIPEGCAEKFVKHDARHDCVMDVMRMQTVIQNL